MFDLAKSFGFNRSLAETGAKRMLGGDPEDYIQLKRIPNPDYRAMLAKEFRAHSAALDTGDDEAKNALSDKILARVLANTVVVGWGKGVQDGGKSVKFSVENCISLFTKYPEFRAACQAWAENNANFQESPEVSAEEVGKS